MLTNGGRLLKRGDTFDIECHRTTYRLGIGQGILRKLGVDLEWEHSDHTGLIGTGLLQRTGHTCDHRCKATWPVWATDEMFNLAYRLADEVQSSRGGHNQAEASRLHEAARAAALAEMRQQYPDAAGRSMDDDA